MPRLRSDCRPRLGGRQGQKPARHRRQQHVAERVAVANAPDCSPVTLLGLLDDADNRDAKALLALIARDVAGQKSLVALRIDYDGPRALDRLDRAHRLPIARDDTIS